MNTLKLFGDIFLFVPHFLVQKDKLIYSKIIELYLNILKMLNKFEFFNEDNNKDILINDIIDLNFGGNSYKKNNDKIKSNEKLYQKNYLLYQNIFMIVVENLNSLLLGVKTISDKGVSQYNYNEDPAIRNFSFTLFSPIKSCLEKFSKFLNSGHNYDLMENILYLFIDYSILFGFKYNLKDIKNIHFNEISKRNKLDEEELLCGIIDVLKNSYLNKYSESLRYAFKNSIEP